MTRIASLLLLTLVTTAASAQVLDGAGDGTTIAPERTLGLADGAFWRGTRETSGPDASNAALALATREALGEHRVTNVRQLSSGVLVELLRVHRGLDVVGSDLALRFDRAGRLRWASPHRVALDDELSIRPTLGARDAMRAAAGAPLAAALSPAAHTRLVVFAAAWPTPARLAWLVRFADDARRQTFRVYVDAHDGHVLSAETLVRHAPEHHARVWDVSPVDGDREDVTFDALPAGATTLADADFEILGCVDRHRCHELRTTSGVRRAHHCDMEPTAFAGADGSFLAIEPPTDHADPDDAFAEVQLYHHLQSGLAAFRFWADDASFALERRLTAIANGRVPDLSSEAAYCSESSDTAPAGSSLQIEENAYFWPAGTIGPTAIGDRIVLHQTEHSDWSYDGEIVWHELVHALMHSVTPLAWRRHDERGVSYEGGGLHEGFSDYFAASISGRPTLAWYGGTTEDGPAPLGDLEAPTDCRDIMTGEEHDESAPWASALWAIRRLLRSEAKRDMFDRALFVVVDSLGQLDGFERASELVLAELALGAEAFIVDEGLDAGAAEFLNEQVASAEARFTERGLPACDGRVQTMALGETKESLQLVGPIVWGFEENRGAPIPASMQLRVELPSDALGIRVRIEEGEAYDTTLREGTELPTRPELELLVREGDTPIRWDWSGARGEDDAERRTAVRFGGDGSAVAELRGDLAAGVYHLQLTNAGADWIAYSITVEVVSEGDDLPIDGAPGDDIGAGCSATPKAGGGTAPAAFLLLALLFVRRRRA